MSQQSSWPRGRASLGKALRCPWKVRNVKTLRNVSMLPVTLPAAASLADVSGLSEVPEVSGPRAQRVRQCVSSYNSYISYVRRGDCQLYGRAARDVGACSRAPEQSSSSNGTAGVRTYEFNEVVLYEATDPWTQPARRTDDDRVATGQSARGATGVTEVAEVSDLSGVLGSTDCRASVPEVGAAQHLG